MRSRRIILQIQVGRLLDAACSWPQNEGDCFLLSWRVLVKVGASKAGLLLAPLALIAIITCAPRIAFGQETTDNSEANARKDSNASDKPKLSDVTRVSTEEATRQAAKEKAKDGKASSDKPNGASEADQERPTASPVTELQPAAKTKDDKVVTDNPADPKLKKIHGSVHGATGSGTQQEGAEVGAGTKSGKTHVYVKTGRTENKQPQ